MTTPTPRDPLNTFREEAKDLLDSFERALLAIEESGAEAAQARNRIDDAFRSLHTIKGSGAMFGLKELVAFAHRFEDALDAIRNGAVRLTPELIDVGLEAADHLRMMLAGEDDAHDHDKIITRLNDALASRADEAGGEMGPKEGATQIYRITFAPNASLLEGGLNIEGLFAELRDFGELEGPTQTSADPKTPAWTATVTTSVTAEALEEVFMFVAGASTLTIEPLVVETKATTMERESLRVSADRLDSLMDQVGELVIAQARLAETSRRIGDLGLASITEDIERHVNFLRDEMLSVRMLPIEMLFSQARRVVRDVGRELMKEIELEITGESTEVDKTVIDRLRDPLVHVIRNAIDHGIEDPDSRTQAGKPRTGKISLRAQQSGGAVHIEVADDGGGLKVDRIRARAIERGLIAEDDALSDEQLHHLIFEPGFSTAATVSNISGRGVGMDVVRKAVEGLRGTISVESRAGEGSTFTLRLPLTLAILDGFHVRVDDSVFVIHLESIEESVDVDASAERADHGRRFIMLRDELVPFVRMHDIFGFDYPEAPNRRMVVVRANGERLGLVVDQILGQEQTVVKPLARFHRSLPGLSGAAILGNGRVALIIDVGDIPAMALDANAADQTPGRRRA